MRQPRPQTAALAKRIEQLAAAIDAYRRDNPRRRLPRGLRTQVVAVIDAGARIQSVRETCKLSGSQISRWRQAARSGSDAAPPSTAASAGARVLSVVDRGTRQDTPLDSEIELRIGGWHVSLRRVAQ